MTITFETDSDVIVYALEKIVSLARERQYLFVANCVWWIASVIGLEPELVIYIDNLEEHQPLAPVTEQLENIHPDRTAQVTSERAISTIPRDQVEDQRRVLTRRTRSSNRINPLPQTKRQLKKA
jgi:hypothetical protein